MSHVVILDEGGETCKLGLSTDSAPRVVPNYAVRQRSERAPLVADRAEQATEYTSLLYRRPKDKGVVVDWELEGMVWTRMFSKGFLPVNPADSALCMLEAPCNPQSDVYMEMALETHGFASVHRSLTAAHAASLPSLEPSPAVFSPPSASSPRAYVQAAAAAAAPAAALVVDVGFSYSHAVPVYRSRPLVAAAKRLDLGGKHLTNYLKDLISYRQWDVSDESYLVNDMKERLCYVSQDFSSDLLLSRGGRRAAATASTPEAAAAALAAAAAMRREYILPNNVSSFTGRVRPLATEVAAAAAAADADPSDAAAAAHAEALAAAAVVEDDAPSVPVASERFTVPELLFRPQDLGGLLQGGLAETCAAAVAAAPAALRPLLWGNIVLVGGSALLPGMAQRLQAELQPSAPAEVTVRVTRPADPLTANWRAGAAFVRAVGEEVFVRELCVSKGEWAEMGASAAQRKFLV